MRFNTFQYVSIRFSPNLIPEFLSMIRRGGVPLNSSSPRVYVSNIFEISADQELPTNKSSLVSLLKSGTVIPFHKTVCPQCHNIPRAKEWVEAEVKPGLHIFHVGKRETPFNRWEPIYICTNNEPW